ncbi:MAG: hypothetical protein SPH80_04755 [Peptoniphilaceae bacterium]|nr:hypothetical protein [Peptoniphilaceae bacterium]
MKKTSPFHSMTGKRLFTPKKPSFLRILRYSIGMLSFAIFLTACGASQAAVAFVGNVQISKQDVLNAYVLFMKEKGAEISELPQASQNVSGQETSSSEEVGSSMDAQMSREAQDAAFRKKTRALLLETVQQMVMEEQVRQDPLVHVDSSERANELWTAALQRFGDEQGLMAQLESLGLTKEEYLQSIRNQAMVEAHKTEFIRQNSPSEEALKDFYRGNKKKCALLTFTKITVPTLSEAKEIRTQLKKDTGVISDYETRFNEDLFEKTSVTHHTDVGWGSPEAIDEDLFGQEAASIDLYYSKESGLYSIVYMESRKDAFSDVHDQVRSLVEEQRYMDHIRTLAKDLHVHIYEENLPSEQAIQAVPSLPF